MIFRELHSQLNERIKNLKSARDRTEASRAQTNLDLSSLQQVHEDNVTSLVSAIEEQVKAQSESPSPKDYQAFLAEFPSEVQPYVRLISREIQTVLDRQGEAREMIQAAPSLEHCKETLDQEKAAFEEREKIYQRVNGRLGYLVKALHLKNAARYFKTKFLDYGLSSRKDYDAFANKNLLIRGVVELFSPAAGTLRSAHTEFMRYANESRSYAHVIEGDINNPLDVLDTFAKVEKEHLVAKKNRKEQEFEVRHAERKLSERQEMEHLISDSFMGKKTSMIIKRLLRQSETAFIALGNHLKPMMVSDRHGQPEPWDANKISGIKAKLDGKQAIVDFHDDLSQQMNASLEALENAFRKLDYKIGQIGSKYVTKIDPKNFERDVLRVIDAQVRKAEASNEWFERNRAQLDRGQFGGIDNPLLLWTAVYLTFSADGEAMTGSENTPELQEATSAFKDTVEATSALDLSDLDLSSVSLLDVAGELHNLEGGLEGVASAMPSMGSFSSSIDSVTSSMDSMTSSFSSSSGSDFGGSMGGMF